MSTVNKAKGPEDSMQDDDTLGMLSKPVEETCGYQLQMRMMLFTPVFFILFFIPHPIFAILKLVETISDTQFSILQATYIVVMCAVFVSANTHFYYKFK